MDSSNIVNKIKVKAFAEAQEKNVSCAEYYVVGALTAWLELAIDCIAGTGFEPEYFIKRMKEIETEE